MKNKIVGVILKSATYISVSMTVCVLLYIIGFIIVKGVPNITPSLFSLTYTSENVSMTPAIISTVIITALSLAVALPFGISAAIYLNEYAKRGSMVVKIIRYTTETLSGIPSIVYGLFGLLFYVGFLGMGFSVLAGSLTLAIMILPLIMRSTEEALKSVPDSYREGSFSLGAGKLRTIFRIILPSAIPGILAGIILAIGRIIGETAALIYTSGTVARIPQTPMYSARTLAVHMYALSGEGFYTGEAYATAVVLLALVVVINSISVVIARKVAG